MLLVSDLIILKSLRMILENKGFTTFNPKSIAGYPYGMFVTSMVGNQLRLVESHSDSIIISNTVMSSAVIDINELIATINKPIQ